MRFGIGRSEVRVSIAALPIPAFCLIAGEWKPLLFALLALAAHEAAHLIAARNAGLCVTRLSVHPFGAVMQTDGPPEARARVWTVALAGPLGSFAFAAALRLFASPSGGSENAEALIRTNLLIAFLNLLPAYPLDGGRVFREILLRTVSERSAKTVLLVMTGAVSVGMIAVGVFLAVKGVPAWTLLAIPPFLLPSALSEWRTPGAGTVSRVMERFNSLKHGAAQRAEIVVVPGSVTVGEAMNALSPFRYTILRVQGPNGSFELDEHALLREAAGSGMHMPLETVIFRLTRT